MALFMALFSAQRPLDAFSHQHHLLNSRKKQLTFVFRFSMRRWYTENVLLKDSALRTRKSLLVLSQEVTSSRQGYGDNAVALVASSFELLRGSYAKSARGPCGFPSCANDFSIPQVLLSAPLLARKSGAGPYEKPRLPQNSRIRRDTI
ncbi:uncharacterized protein M421DRAFT_267180 [Didymella exigua CBS 183.55]|uniref:Uncharacterized protein n=1 Tax=Didymella exigua CBS 183.55 TaxID=1150837 RepID=A0A6A5RBI9_9PLEO|nr:uncharacterized protein M421DRAFT_267180 [Didymella exigua CBS 183.55]KAF1925012.1 hypothetical protein M421DRAFT_267180 [Didymella exigua CBS 183.55]